MEYTLITEKFLTKLAKKHKVKLGAWQTDETMCALELVALDKFGDKAKWPKVLDKPKAVSGFAFGWDDGTKGTPRTMKNPAYRHAYDLAQTLTSNKEIL